MRSGAAAEEVRLQGNPGAGTGLLSAVQTHVLSNQVFPLTIRVNSEERGTLISALQVQ
jgi:hypothetical protein